MDLFTIIARFLVFLLNLISEYDVIISRITSVYNLVCIVSTQGYSAVIKDANGDGKGDLLCGTQYGFQHIYYNVFSNNAAGGLSVNI